MNTINPLIGPKTTNKNAPAHIFSRSKGVRYLGLAPLNGLSFGSYSRNVYVQPITAIGQLPVHDRTDAVRDRLHGAIAHQELTRARMGAAELPNAPFVPIIVVSVLNW